MELRYERKFRTEDLSKEEVEFLVKINKYHFKDIHNPRIVNNIYLDTEFLSDYFDSLNGIHDKKKIRVRWYGTTFGVIKEPVLEIKIRKGFLGEKLKFPLRPFKINKDSNLKNIKSLILKSDIPENIKSEIKSARVVSFNSYTRKYFISADKKYRLTIDYDIKFINGSRVIRDDAVILELKYDKEQDNEVEKISAQFPFRMTKNSKYVEGVERFSMNSLS